MPSSLLNISIAVRHGDRDDLKKKFNPSILITTPESLDVLLFRKEPKLSSIRAIVLDEVHLLYNTQRGLQLSILLRRLSKILEHKIQWAALSATVGNPEFIRDFLVGKDENTVFISSSTNREIDAHIRKLNSLRDISSLIRLLTDNRDTKLLIFANSRKDCENIACMLKEDRNIAPVIIAHYSSLSPEFRVETEQRFSSLRTAICIATSTLELGIDIGDIDAVILYGIPGGVASFLQRIGRGNRRGHKSNVICLIPETSENKTLDALLFYSLLDSAKKGNLPVEEPYELFGALAQQFLSIIASEQGRYTRIADICNIFDFKPYISRKIIESMLAEYAYNGIIQKHVFKNSYGIDEGLHRLVNFRLIYGNFGEASREMKIFHGSKELGNVPVRNLLIINRNDIIRYAGRIWKVININRDGIHLKPAKHSINALDFKYDKSGIKTDCFIINNIWKIATSNDLDMKIFNKDMRNEIISFLSNINKISDHEQIPFIKKNNDITYYTFAGYTVNKALGLYTGDDGFIANEISLTVKRPLNWTDIPDNPESFHKYINDLFETTAEQSIFQKGLPLDLQYREFMQHWTKNTIHKQILKRLSKSSPIEISKLPF